VGYSLAERLPLSKLQPPPTLGEGGGSVVIESLCSIELNSSLIAKLMLEEDYEGDVVQLHDRML